MKPYKVNNTWVDLDHVLAVDDKVIYVCYSGLIAGYADMNFRDKPLSIFFGNSCPEWTEHEKTMENAQAIWDDFKTAWMNKDKKTEE